MTMQPTISVSPTPVSTPSVPPTTAALAIADLMFTYPGAAAPTLDLPVLNLAPAEQILLTGGSGRGKSTLLQLIAGLIDPQGGKVRISGTAIHALRSADRDRFRGQRIGMIFQTFNLLLGFSARENVMAALMFGGVHAGEQRSRAAALLESLGIERMDRPVDELSVGQQQRVAAARAVACSPTLVLADEPTASLDPANAAQAMDLIQSVCRSCGAALLCVSHDPSMTSRFIRVESLAELSRTHAVGHGAAA